MLLDEVPLICIPILPRPLVFTSSTEKSMQSIFFSDRLWLEYNVCIPND